MKDDLTLGQKMAYVSIIDVVWNGEIGLNYTDKIRLKTADAVDLALREIMSKTSMIIYLDYTFRRFKHFYDAPSLNGFRSLVGEKDRQNGGFILANLMRAIKRNDKYKIYLKKIALKHKKRVQTSLISR